MVQVPSKVWNTTSDEASSTPRLSLVTNGKIVLATAAGAGVIVSAPAIAPTSTATRLLLILVGSDPPSGTVQSMIPPVVRPGHTREGSCAPFQRALLRLRRRSLTLSAR